MGFALEQYSAARTTIVLDRFEVIENQVENPQTTYIADYETNKTREGADIIAYVYRPSPSGWNGEIQLCFPNILTRSHYLAVEIANIIIHEFTHGVSEPGDNIKTIGDGLSAKASNNSNGTATVSKGIYGADNVRYIAELRPDQIIYVADAYSQFAEYAEKLDAATKYIDKISAK